MLKVEGWRLEELGLLLDDLAAVLKAGRHPEWAGVFGHFSHELAIILQTKSSDPTVLRRLVQNIRLCFDGNSGFLRLSLRGEDDGESAALDLRMALLKARTADSLQEIEQRLVERVS
jgi:hypothetical protein